MPSRRQLSLPVVVLAVLAPSAAAQAATTVPARDVLTVDRIDSPTAVGLPDGRALIGWTNGNNSGDSTLAMVRPAGGVLPAAPQVLRTGFSTEDLGFLAGGPSGTPVVTSFQDSLAGSPFAVRLEGDRFTAQSPIFNGTYSIGRFPRYARCPDGTTVFTYQYTNPGSPATPFSTSAARRDAKGLVQSGPSFGSSASADSFQLPTPTCDDSLHPLVARQNDQDGTAGGTPQHLYVRDLAGGPVMDRTVPAGSQGSIPVARNAPDGRLWIVWSEYAGATDSTYVVTQAPGVSGLIPTTSPPSLSPNVTGAKLFFGKNGTTHLLVSRETGPGATTYALRTAAAGAVSFGPETPVDVPSDASAEILTGNPDGAPRLLTTQYGSASTDPTTLRVSGIPAAGSTGAPVVALRSLAQFTDLSYLASGDLLVVGAEARGPAAVALIEGGIDTGAPPTLANLNVPGSAVPLEATPLSVDAGDGLGLASFAWTVDGRTLPDQKTAYRFPRPGSFVVTARATDRAGATTQISRTVRVLDPAAVAPDRGPGGASGATADRTAPTAKLSASRTRSGVSARTVRVLLSSSEVAAVDVELIGTLKRGKAKGTLILKSARVGKLLTGAPKTVRLAFDNGLARLVSSRLSVRATFTDVAGNRTTKIARVIAKAAKKRGTKRTAGVL